MMCCKDGIYPYPSSGELLLFKAKVDILNIIAYVYIPPYSRGGSNDSHSVGQLTLGHIFFYVRSY